MLHQHLAATGLAIIQELLQLVIELVPPHQLGWCYSRRGVLVQVPSQQHCFKSKLLRFLQKPLVEGVHRTNKWVKQGFPPGTNRSKVTNICSCAIYGCAPLPATMFWQHDGQQRYAISLHSLPTGCQDLYKLSSRIFGGKTQLKSTMLQLPIIGIQKCVAIEETAFDQFSGNRSLRYYLQYLAIHV